MGHHHHHHKRGHVECHVRRFGNCPSFHEGWVVGDDHPQRQWGFSGSVPKFDYHTGVCQHTIVGCRNRSCQHM